MEFEGGKVVSDGGGGETGGEVVGNHETHRVVGRGKRGDMEGGANCEIALAGDVVVADSGWGVGGVEESRLGGSDSGCTRSRPSIHLSG